MDLLNMTNRAKIHELYKKVKQTKFLSFKPVLKFVDLLIGLKLTKNAKFQHNISKIYAIPKNTGTWIAYIPVK